MDIMELGAIGELVGGVAVIASLGLWSRVDPGVVSFAVEITTSSDPG